MAILAQSRVCPFKEDKELIKQIDYKQYKFLRNLSLIRVKLYLHM